MPILVKDRDMPDACGSCPCFHAETPMYCQAVKASVQKPRIVRPYAKGRPEWCPLVHVPPHGDLIERDELPISTAVPLDGKPYQYVHIDNIKGAPTIIPAEEGET